MNCQKAIQILSKFVENKRISKLLQILEKRTIHFLPIIDRIYHQHNISAVTRSVDAFGVQEVWFVGCEKLSVNKGVSIGADKWLTIKHLLSPKEAILKLRELNYTLSCAVLPTESSCQKKIISLPEVDITNKLALVFGNEKEGVEKDFLNEADFFFTIPMYGFSESLNISVAAAITLFFLREKASREKIPLTPLPYNCSQQLLFKWLKREVKGADIILEKELKNKSL